MWRKTRSVNDGSTCVGTDANQNYDFQWDVEGIGGWRELHAIVSKSSIFIVFKGILVQGIIHSVEHIAVDYRLVCLVMNTYIV